MKKINIILQDLDRAILFFPGTYRILIVRSLLAIIPTLMFLSCPCAKAQVNIPTDSLGIPDISASPVVQEDQQERAKLAKDRLYKPSSDDIIIGRGINIDKADLDKYFPNGVDLSLSDAQLNSRLEELKREETYRYLSIISAILLLGFFVLRYFKDRSKKKILL